MKLPSAVRALAFAGCYALLASCGRDPGLEGKSPTHVAQVREANSFLSFCKDLAVDPRASLTVKALLVKAGTSDCEKAQAQLSLLTELDLQNMSLTDLRPLSGFGSLIHLYISNNRIVDLTPLAGLTKLQTLWLSNNPVDLNSMPPLAGLSDLSLANTDVADLSPLPRVAPNLSVLSVARNVIRDLDPLASLSRIERLNVSSNQIGSLAPLAKLARLRVLEFIPIPETRSA